MLATVATLVAIGAVGFALRRGGLVSAQVTDALEMVTRRIAAPCLYFVVAARANVAALWSTFSLAVLASCVAVVLALIGWAALRGGRTWPDAVFRSGAGVSTSLGGVGFALTSAAFGDVAPLVPVLVLQVVVLGPALTAARRGASASGWRSRSRAWVRANPAFFPLLAGSALAAVWREAPSAVLDPLESLGAASIPLVVLSLGMAWAAPRPPRERGAGRPLGDVLVARVALLPLASWCAGLALGLADDELVALVAVMCLPLAHDVGLYAPAQGELGARATRTATVGTAVGIAVFTAVALAVTG